MAAGAALTMILNWVAGRLATTPEILSIVVGGTTQSFSQPAAPGTVNGTQNVAVVRNTNIAYNNVVTTADNQTATSTASVAWWAKRYWGFVGSENPDDAAIIALAQEFAKIRTKSSTTVSNSSSRRFAWVIPLALDPSAVTQIWVGGLDTTAAFTRTVRDLTNASGYLQQYAIYVQQTETAAGVTFEIK